MPMWEEESEDLKKLGGRQGVMDLLAAEGFTLMPNDLFSQRAAEAMAKLITERDAALGDLMHYQNVAITDALTSLPNRKAFDQRFAQAARFKKRHPEVDIAVVFFDVNKFKAINSAHTHAGGDAALTHLAKVLKKRSTDREEVTPENQHDAETLSIANVLRGSARPDDFIARFAGDEFVAILPGASKEQAEGFIRRMMDVVRDSTCEYNGERVALSITGGVHMLQVGEDIETVKASASKAMLSNKEASYAHAAGQTAENNVAINAVLPNQGTPERRSGEWRIEFD